MRNYQKLHYQHYYAQTSTDDCVPVSRRECFAPPEEPTADNPFKQRWFYDPEAGYAVRLERSAYGDAIHRIGGASLKREERHKARKSQCVWKNTMHCDQNCDRCTRCVSRTVDIDRPHVNQSDGAECPLEFADVSANVEAIAQDRAMLSALIAVLNELTQDEQALWAFLIAKAKKQEIADRFNLTLDGVRYREKRLFAKIRSDDTLRNYFDVD